MKFSKGLWHRVKIQERNGPSQGIIQKCAPHESNPRAPKFDDRIFQETLKQERSLGLGEKCLQAHKKEDKTTSYSRAEAWVMLALSSKKARRARIRGRLRSIDAHAEQKGCKLKRNPSKIQEPPQRWQRPMEKCKQERRHRSLFTILISP